MAAERFKTMQKKRRFFCDDIVHFTGATLGRRRVQLNSLRFCVAYSSLPEILAVHICCPSLDDELMEFHMEEVLNLPDDRIRDVVPQIHLYFLRFVCRFRFSDQGICTTHAYLNFSDDSAESGWVTTTGKEVGKEEALAPGCPRCPPVMLFYVRSDVNLLSLPCIEELLEETPCDWYPDIPEADSGLCCVCGPVRADDDNEDARDWHPKLPQAHLRRPLRTSTTPPRPSMQRGLRVDL
eukprot:gnl/TRDRNA2_/TRDRNA2_143792_c0_seq2.p1 gnl/TRDRNA2_/TRDRNA2_143792_c0~~gnl/TRDRNA2_/TRDRNA2_143792_c0_seq2.p1  ORF type:complete len:238 (+),score=27.65 gnl/TRDRNA2_/TRDRNA2_143792_c0_seq2:232-945(+)